MTLASMSIIHAAIVRVADDFDFDQNFKAEYTFDDATAGGWAPTPGAATALASSEAPEEREAAALRRRAERARLPWYRRSARVLSVLIRPLLLPEPMKLY